MLPYENPVWIVIASAAIIVVVIWASPDYVCTFEPTPDAADIRTCAPARDLSDCMQRLGHERVCRKVEKK